MKKAFNRGVSLLAIVVIIGIIATGWWYYSNKESETPQDAMDAVIDIEINKAQDDTTTGTTADEEASSGEDRVLQDLNQEGAEPGAMTQKQKEAAVAYTDNGFEPKTIEVAIGTKVTFTNKSGKRMWVASNEHPTHEIYKEFDQGAAGTTYSFVFDKKGTWTYHNHVSPGHVGTIIVK